MISVPHLGIEPPDDVLARYRESAATVTRALCVETSISIGTSPSPHGAHLVLLPLGGQLEALIRRLGVDAAR